MSLYKYFIFYVHVDISYGKFYYNIFKTFKESQHDIQNINIIFLNTQFCVETTKLDIYKIMKYFRQYKCTLV